MPKSKNHRNKKYDSNKASKKKMIPEEESYSYGIPYFVKTCGLLLLAFNGALIAFVVIKVIISYNTGV